MSLRAHSEKASGVVRAEPVGKDRTQPVVVGLPPKFWRRSRIMRSGFPFARNGSLSLQRVLDDAFARIHHRPLEDLLDGLLGLFSLGSKGASGRGSAEKQLTMAGQRSLTE